MPGRARPRLRRWHREFLARTARDITPTIAARSALVLAPHPDDETLGCGLTILQKTRAGTRVRVVIAADGGDERRRSECREACRRLGVAGDSVVFLGLPDGRLAAMPTELDQALRNSAGTFRAEDLFAPCSVDNHADHRALAAAARRLRDSEMPSARLLTYPIWFWNRFAWTDRSRPRNRQRLDLLLRPLGFTVTTRPVVVHAPQDRATKRDALSAHASQLAPSPDPPALEVLDADWLELFLRGDEVFFSGVPR